MEEIIEELMPAVHKARKETGTEDDALVDAAARENVRMTCEKLLAYSPHLRSMSQKGEIKIMGAYKILSSGYVEFFE
jgi:carbonic anhydrase